MHKFMSELGLSPVSRMRVETLGPVRRSKFEGLLGPKPWEWKPADDYLPR